MTFVKKIVLVFSFICIVGNIFSQTFNFKNYNTEQGLPQSQVLSIYQDAKGYVWFGTNSGGVGKFDGNKFTNLSINDGLINNVVYSITGNKKGELFFGTGKGLSVYNQFTFKNFNEKNGLTNAAIYKVICYENKIWIGTDKGVFIYFDGKVTAFSPDSILNNSSVSSIFADKENNLWFGTLQNGIVYFDVKNKIFKHLSTKDGLTNNFVFSISQMQNGIILVGTQTGLNKINSKFEVMPADEIESNRNISFSCIEKSEADKFYFGTYSEGLMDFDFNEQKRKFFKGNNGLTNNAILCVLKDKEGNLWVGTDGAGAFKYFNKKFVYYTVGNGLPDKYISAVSEDEAGNLWIAMPSKGLAKIFKNEISYYKADFKQGKSLPDNTVNSILSAKDGKIYFGTQDGLCIFEKDNFKIPDDKLIRHNYIYSLFEDSKKNIWIGTSKGAFMFNGIEVSAVESINKLKQKGIPLMILSITEDKAGNIWMGTDNGVIRIADNKSIRFNDEKTFINGRVGVCISDEKGNVWMGTEHGLYNYSKNLFKKIAVEYNLQPAFINFLQIDKKNNLIIGSNNGIDILNLNEYYNNKKAVRHLGKDDGLLSLESNSNASAIDKNNRILIGTVNGLEIYDSELDILNQNEASINITNTKLFFGQENILDYADGVDSTSLLPKNLVLTYTKNNITFQYIGISLMAPEKVLYRFKLEGIDSDWSPPVNKTEATYPSLPAGNYTFFVKAANNDGLWNKTPASFSFSILPPWYNTWWFYTSCVFVLVCGIIIYNNYRTKKLIADKIRLENTVNIRTKELRDEKEKVELINVEVNLQKQEIEHKNVEITDSIKYAKNIQEALLPSLSETEKAFNNCFVLYMPKDIVSGDFFWYAKKNNLQYIAAADCTGHGVPGAFMSIVGNTLLNEIVNEKNISKPGDILLELHKSVKLALNSKNSDTERRDGMDIALCCFNKNSNKIEYAGANRPLWIFRKNKNFELEIIKPTKQPIGGLEMEERRTYHNHEIEIFEGDCIYIFSDGFADQFGGQKGKKFMLSNMQKLLFSNLKLSMPEQKLKIKEAFMSWKQELEQIDDVLVIGMKA